MASQTTTQNIQGLQSLVESFMVQIGTKVDVIFATCLQLQDRVEELEEHVKELREWKESKESMEREKAEDVKDTVEAVEAVEAVEDVVNNREVIDLTYSPEISPTTDDESDPSDDEDDEELVHPKAAKVKADEDSNSEVSESEVSESELKLIEVLEKTRHDDDLNRALEVSAMEYNVDDERRRLGMATIGRMESQRGFEDENDHHVGDKRPREDASDANELYDDDDVDEPVDETVDEPVNYEAKYDDDATIDDVEIVNPPEIKYNQSHSLYKSDLPTSGQVIFGEIDSDGWVTMNPEPHFAQLSWDDGVVVETTDTNGHSTVYHFAALCDGVYYPARVHSRYHHASKYTLQLENINAGDFCMKIIDYVDLEVDSLDSPDEDSE